MTHETTHEQAPARVEHPAPVGKTEPPEGATFSEEAVVAQTDTDLQAVAGGGGTSGGVLRNGGRTGGGSEV